MEAIELIMYGIIFIMGTLFGSFFTLAVYRIPLGIDIFLKHSFCPNCNKELKFKDLIPVISYIILKGKCRYCGQKVRIRYLLLEVLTGITFVLFAFSLKLNFLELTIQQIIYIVFYVLYMSGLFIIAGIDKEKIRIENLVLNFEVILSVLFMIYVCISKQNVIYTYIILLAMFAFLLILNTLILKKNKSANYTISILILSLCMIVFNGNEIYYYSVVSAVFIIVVYLLIQRLIKIKFEKDNKKTDENTPNLKVPIGFYLVITNIVWMIIGNFIK